MANHKGEGAPRSVADRGSADDVNGSNAKVARYDDGIEICAGCRKRLGDESFRGAVITRIGMAQFRLCGVCRFIADDKLLRRLTIEAEQRLALAGPVGGHA